MEQGQIPCRAGISEGLRQSGGPTRFTRNRRSRPHDSGSTQPNILRYAVGVASPRWRVWTSKRGRRPGVETRANHRAASLRLSCCSRIHREDETIGMNHTEPHRGFSRASCSTRSRISRRIGGRPTGRAYVHRLAIKPRCQRSSVAGVTITIANARAAAVGWQRRATPGRKR